MLELHCINHESYACTHTHIIYCVYVCMYIYTHISTYYELDFLIAGSQHPPLYSVVTDIQTTDQWKTKGTSSSLCKVYRVLVVVRVYGPAGLNLSA